MHPFRRLAATTTFMFGVLALIALGAVACGNSAEQVSGERIAEPGGDDGSDVGDGESGVYDTDKAGDDDGSGDDSDSGDTEPADLDGDGETDAAMNDNEGTEPELEPAELEEVLPRIVNDVGSHEMSDEETECMIAETEDSPVLTDLVNAYDNPMVAPDESSVYEFSLAMQRCIAAEPLAFQIAQGWGFVGPGADPSADPTATEPITIDELDDSEQETVDCFATQIDGPTGSEVYSTLFTRLLGFDSDPEAYEPTIEALTECAPSSAIAKNMATQVEASGGFTSSVDIDCASEAVDDKRESLWRGVIANEGTGFQEVDEAIRECTTEIDDGLLDEPADSWVPWAGGHELAEVTPRSRNDVYEEAPEMTIDPEATYTAVVATGGGEIRLALDAENSPLTVNNFVNLANDGFYDGLTFHRVLDGFMAQGGDPLGTGTGGPGYQFDDEVDNGLAFDKVGQLAMANSGPGTNGSQFFITFDATDFLTGDHTIFGEVTEGEDVLMAIERRDPATAQGPGQVIESITIIEE